MAITNSIQYFIGVVTYIENDPDHLLDKDKTYHEVICDIPGVIEGVKAFPKRGDMDEPQVGDQVLLLCLDPMFKSYFIYEKLKENDFIGFRAHGKMVDITPDKITVGIFNPKNTYPDSYHPVPDAEVTIEKNGDITIKTDSKVNIKGTDIVVKGEDVKVDGTNVTITGGKLNLKGTVTPGTTGPFNCIPTCPYTGLPHAGNMVSGT